MTRSVPMVHTYQSYLDASPHDRITFEQCGRVLDKIIAAMDLDDPVYSETWEDFIGVAITYTKIRADFSLMSITEITEQSAKRTSAHNAVIDSLTAVVRLMARDGHDTKWANEFNIDLTDANRAKTKFNRRKIGDFANYLVYINALSTRLV